MKSIFRNVELCVYFWSIHVKEHVYVFAFVTCDRLRKDRNAAAENLFLSLNVMFLQWDNFKNLPQNVLQKRER